MDASSGDYRDRVVDLQRDLANAWAVVQRLTTQHSFEKNLLDCVRTALAVQKTALQQLVAAGVKDREKLLADNAAFDNEVCKFQKDISAKFDSLSSSLENKANRAKALDSECVEFDFSEEYFERQRQLRSDDREELEELEYRLDGSFAKERGFETIIKSLRQMLLSV